MVALKLTWLSFVFVLIAPRIQAQSVPELVYRVPSNCPSEADFVARVAARGGKFGADDGRSFEVSVVMRGPSFAGSLRVQRGDQESDAREVTGASCAEVCEALAVVTAI